MGRASRSRREAAKKRAEWGRERGLRPDAALPENPEMMFWLPMRFTCGHALDFGIDTSRYPDFEQRLGAFLDAASAFPCVRCGSATGIAHDRPVEAKPTYLVANDLWYRACSSERQADASRNGEVARRNRKAR